MNLSLRRVGACAVAGAAALALAWPATTAQAALAPAPAAVPAAAYLVGWSDGVAISDPRTFTEQKYKVAANLPYVEVQASCGEGAKRGAKLRLQFRYEGKYYTEDEVVVKNCNGRYGLYLNPYTESGAWAVGNYRYRVILPGSKSAVHFSVTFAKK